MTVMKFIAETLLSIFLLFLVSTPIALYKLWEEGYFSKEDNSELIELIANTDYRDQLIQLASRERGDYLEESEDLNSLAEDRAEYLCTHPFEHDGWEKWFMESDYTFYGENIARNYGVRLDASDTLHRAFMDSPEHKGNILNPNYKFMGIGRSSCGNPFETTEELESDDITVEFFAG